MTQKDLEKVLATSKKTQVAASEYSGFSSVSRSPRDRDEVQAAINGISKLFVSRIINSQSDSNQRDSEEASE